MATLSTVRRILVVDDEGMVLELMRDLLVAAGYEVTVTQDPQKAVKLIWKENYDAILTDLGMPVVSGWAVARQAKAKNTSTPVIVITGWGAQYEEENASRFGVDLVLGKPLEWKKLAGAIATLVTRPIGRLVEIRRHLRLPGRKGEMARLSSWALESPLNLARIMDISRNGLSFGHSRAANGPGELLNLDLTLAGSVEIASVACKVMYDIPCGKESAPGQACSARRCGVQFMQLSESQVYQLESCIQERACEEDFCRD